MLFKTYRRQHSIFCNDEEISPNILKYLSTHVSFSPLLCASLLRHRIMLIIYTDPSLRLQVKISLGKYVIFVFLLTLLCFVEGLCVADVLYKEGCQVPEVTVLQKSFWIQQWNLMFLWPCIMNWPHKTTNVMHFIRQILLLSSTCFEYQVLIFRRT